MNKERKIEPEKIHILSIKTLKGKIENDADSSSSAIVGYRYKNALAVALNLNEKIVGLKHTIYIDTLNKKQEELEIKASYTHEFIFRVDNLNDFVDDSDDAEEKEEKEENIDPILLGTLAGIAYSTVRGIVMNRTQGTALNAVILPVIDPKKLTDLTVEEGKN
jgi:hypothetical protein